uniref:Uncharacterized protein n=1 Tax=Cucumis melo TaxID=3656 RepID=A0A9I9E5G0_CUCME
MEKFDKNGCPNIGLWFIFFKNRGSHWRMKIVDFVFHLVLDYVHDFSKVDRYLSKISDAFPPSLFYCSFLFRFSTVALFRHFSTIDFSSVAFPPFARPSFFNRFAPPKVLGGLGFDSKLSVSIRQKLLNLEKAYVGYNLQILETRMKLEHIHQGGDSQYTGRTQSIYHRIRSSLVVKPWKKFKGNTLEYKDVKISKIICFAPFFVEIYVLMAMNISVKFQKDCLSVNLVFWFRLIPFAILTISILTFAIFTDFPKFYYQLYLQEVIGLLIFKLSIRNILEFNKID